MIGKARADARGQRRRLNTAPRSFAHADPSWLNRIGAATTYRRRG
jgi:hypothetical protein